MNPSHKYFKLIAIRQLSPLIANKCPYYSMPATLEIRTLSRSGSNFLLMSLSKTITDDLRRSPFTINTMYDPFSVAIDKKARTRELKKFRF